LERAAIVKNIRDRHEYAEVAVWLYGGPRGYDAGKKINGRKRHALVDTDGPGLIIEPHPTSVQDRDGGGPLLRVSRRAFPFIEKVFADNGYAGDRVAAEPNDFRNGLLVRA
jgi:hypothetical protein